jgi:hypothetical protein
MKSTIEYRENSIEAEVECERFGRRDDGSIVRFAPVNDARSRSTQAKSDDGGSN